jgi:hypothetical protein
MPNTSTVSTSLDRLHSITGTSNQANPYGSIPCVIGELRMFPPLAAMPFSELSGDDQYLRMLFDLGYGDVQVSDMKIGDSDLSSFTDVEYEIGTAPALFSDDINEQTAGDALNNDGNLAVRTSAPNADEVAVDLIFPSGLIGADTKGKMKSVSCTLKVEYSPTGAGAWQSVTAATGLTISNPAAAVSGTNIVVTNSARKAIRIGVRWKVASGQYDVRITRVSTNWNGADVNSRAGDLTWGVIRAIRHTLPSTTGTKKLALRIKATDQLNGTINQFNLIASQPIPVWDGSGWINAVSNNPAFVYRWLLKDCPANPRPVDISRIDDDELIAWAAECTAKDLTFAIVQDSATTMFSLIRDVCAAGRASFNHKDGKYSVVRDTPQVTPVQVFTPRNTWGFSGTRAFTDVVHALRVQFNNPEANYQQDERVVYADGYSEDGAGGTLLATKFETLQIRGCVDASGAWRLGRYYMACAEQRANVYSWSTDVENLASNRGDLVYFAHDVIAVGLSWGRIKTTTIDGGTGKVSSITIDESVQMEAGKTYAVRIRCQDGTVKISNIAGFNTVGIGTTSLNLATELSGPQPGDLFLFGESGKDSLQLKITKIEPGADLSAKITAVDAAPGVLDADSGVVPSWTSAITGKPWNDAPPPPNLVIVASGQTVGGEPNDGGITAPGIVVGIGAAPSGPIRTPMLLSAYGGRQMVGL